MPKIASILFGYDFFISFTLGPHPRGSQSYASDLARRLSKKKYSVFFSETELPPGSTLSSSLLKALSRSKVLIVIANKSALVESKWVTEELEFFSNNFPNRKVVIINIHRALELYAEISPSSIWRNNKEKVFLNDTEESLVNGIIDESYIERLNIIPELYRTNVQVKVITGLIACVILGLSWMFYVQKVEAEEQKGIALLQKTEAIEQRKKAVLSLVARMQDQGEYKAALHQLTEEIELPAQVVENAKISLFEVKNFFSDEMPYGHDQFSSIVDENNSWIVSQARYSGITIIDENLKIPPENCGEESRFVKVVTSSERQYFYWIENDSEGKTIYRGSSGKCRERAFSLKNKINSDDSIVTFSVNKNTILLSTKENRVFLFSEDFIELNLKDPIGDIAAVALDSNENSFMIIDTNGNISLYGIDGNSLLPPTKLKKDGLTVLHDESLSNFLIGKPDGVFHVESIRNDLEVATHHDFSFFNTENRSYIYFMDFSGKDSAPSTVWFDHYSSICTSLNWIDSKFYNQIYLGKCEGRKNITKEIPNLPIPITGYANYYSSAVYCEDRNSILVGTWGGYLAWLRAAQDIYEIGPRRLELEHFEKVASDAITALRCTAHGGVIAGARSEGIIKFQSPFTLYESIQDGVQSYPNFELDILKGNTQVITAFGTGSISTIDGEIFLNVANVVRWRRKVASPVEYQTGDNTSEDVYHVEVDGIRGRVWALTTWGRLYLLDLNNGSMLSMFATSFYSASGGMSTPILSFDVTSNGGVKFSYVKDRSDQDKVYVTEISINTQ